MPLQSGQTESGLYNYGLSPHQPREGQRGGGIRPRADPGVGSYIGAQSFAQIVFYRPSRRPPRSSCVGRPSSSFPPCRRGKEEIPEIRSLSNHAMVKSRCSAWTVHQISVRFRTHRDRQIPVVDVTKSGERATILLLPSFTALSSPPPAYSFLFLAAPRDRFLALHHVATSLRLSVRFRSLCWYTRSNLRKSAYARREGK